MELAELAWLIPAFSFIAFFLIVIFGKFLPGKGSFIAILAIGAGFAMFWVVLKGYLGLDIGSENCPEGFDAKTCIFNREWFTAADVVLRWGIIIDPLAIVMLGMVTLVGLMIQVYSLGYMAGDSRFGWYFAVHALFIASMLSLVLADNFLLLYVVWELVGVCSFLLIGFWYERRSAAEAAKKAFITTRLGDVGLLVGVLLLGKAVGDATAGATFNFDMSDTFAAIEANQLGQGTINAAAILLFLGAMGKSAQFPLHVWLPDAMEGPHPGERPDTRRHYGSGGGVPGGPRLPHLRGGPRCHGGGGCHRPHHGPAGRYHGPGYDGPEASPGLLHHKPSWADDAVSGRFRLYRRHIPPDGPRLFQGPAVSWSGKRYAQHGRRDGYTEDGRPVAGDALHRRHLHHRRVVLGRNTHIRRVLEQG